MNFDSPHRRFNPLTGEWVLVSPHRAKRPWLGQVEKTPPESLPSYDPTCYLCPGNDRAGGVKNPKYSSTFVFDNDFSALLPAETPEPVSSHPLLASVPERGLCRVVCFSPRHDLTMPELEQAAIENVLLTWTEQTAELSRKDFIQYVQVFENKGALMGCSNPHPHSQIWATEHIPNEPAKEFQHQKAYFDQHHHALLADYLNEENKRGERIIFQNTDFTALVPFWAIWPFEVLLVAHRPLAYLTEMNAEENRNLAESIKEITTRYDNLFEISFPYSMGFHKAPFDGQLHPEWVQQWRVEMCMENPEWVFHAHFYPPLLRSATVRKFMVGYEMLAMPQRDITPEMAADRLRSLSNVHHKHK